MKKLCCLFTFISAAISKTAYAASSPSPESLAKIPVWITVVLIASAFVISAGIGIVFYKIIVRKKSGR